MSVSRFDAWKNEVVKNKDETPKSVDPVLRSITEHSFATVSTTTQHNDAESARRKVTCSEINCLRELCTLLNIDVAQFRKAVGVANFPSKAFFESEFSPAAKIFNVRQTVLYAMRAYYQQKYQEISVIEITPALQKGMRSMERIVAPE